MLFSKADSFFYASVPAWKNGIFRFHLISGEVDVAADYPRSFFNNTGAITQYYNLPCITEWRQKKM